MGSFRALRLLIVLSSLLCECLRLGSASGVDNIPSRFQYCNEVQKRHHYFYFPVLDFVHRLNFTVAIIMEEDPPDGYFYKYITFDITLAINELPPYDVLALEYDVELSCERITTVDLFSGFDYEYQLFYSISTKNEEGYLNNETLQEYLNEHHTNKRLWFYMPHPDFGFFSGKPKILPIGLGNLIIEDSFMIDCTKYPTICSNCYKQIPFIINEKLYHVDNAFQIVLFEQDPWYNNHLNVKYDVKVIENTATQIIIDFEIVFMDIGSAIDAARSGIEPVEFNDTGILIDSTSYPDNKTNRLVIYRDAGSQSLRFNVDTSSRTLNILEDELNITTGTLNVLENELNESSLQNAILIEQNEILIKQVNESSERNAILTAQLEEAIKANKSSTDAATYALIAVCVTFVIDFLYKVYSDNKTKYQVVLIDGSTKTKLENEIKTTKTELEKQIKAKETVDQTERRKEMEQQIDRMKNEIMQQMKAEYGIKLGTEARKRKGTQ